MDTIRLLVIKALEAVAHSIETRNSAAVRKAIHEIRQGMREEHHES